MTSEEEDDRPPVEHEADSDDAQETRVAGQATESDEQEANLETALAEEDDGRTELVTHIAPEVAEDGDPDDERGAGAVASAAVATRALKDKTKPPAVEGGDGRD